MALQFKHFSKDFNLEFPEAYARILGGSFSNTQVDYMVGVYPNKKTRDAEKKFADALIDVEQAEDKRHVAEQEFIQCTNALIEADQKLRSFSGDTKSEDYQKLSKDFMDAENSRNKAQVVLQEFAKKCDDLRTYVSKLPTSKPLSTEKFSFKFNDKVGKDIGIYAYGYQNLKKADIFSDSEDV